MDLRQGEKDFFVVFGGRANILSDRRAMFVRVCSDKSREKEQDIFNAPEDSKRAGISSKIIIADTRSKVRGQKKVQKKSFSPAAAATAQSFSCFLRWTPSEISNKSAVGRVGANPHKNQSARAPNDGVSLRLGRQIIVVTPHKTQTQKKKKPPPNKGRLLARDAKKRNVFRKLTRERVWRGFYLSRRRRRRINNADLAV